jgi:hypothetical protein
MKLKVLKKKMDELAGYYNQLDAKITATGWPSLDTFYKTPSMSPYPALATAGLTTVHAIARKNLPLMGITAGFLVSGYSLRHDVQNGSSTATAWSVVYLSIFSKQRKNILLTGVVAGNLINYGREMVDFDSWF